MGQVKDEVIITFPTVLGKETGLEHRGKTCKILHYFFMSFKPASLEGRKADTLGLSALLGAAPSLSRPSCMVCTAPQWPSFPAVSGAGWEGSGSQASLLRCGISMFGFCCCSVDNSLCAGCCAALLVEVCQLSGKGLSTLSDSQLMRLMFM